MRKQIFFEDLSEEFSIHRVQIINYDRIMFILSSGTINYFLTINYSQHFSAINYHQTSPFTPFVILWSLKLAIFFYLRLYMFHTLIKCVRFISTNILAINSSLRKIKYFSGISTILQRFSTCSFDPVLKIRRNAISWNICNEIERNKMNYFYQSKVEVSIVLDD